MAQVDAYGSIYQTTVVPRHPRPLHLLHLPHLLIKIAQGSNTRLRMSPHVRDAVVNGHSIIKKYALPVSQGG